jgi:hypothetical protein
MNHSKKKDHDDKKAYVEVDIYGLKLPYTPSTSKTEEEILTGKEVTHSIRQSLLRIARDSFGFIADTFTSARSFIGGVGKLPNALANRVDNAHRQADVSMESADEIAKEDAIESVENTLAAFRAQGISAEIRELPDGNVAIIVTRPELVDAGHVAAEVAMAKLTYSPDRIDNTKGKKLVGEDLLNARLDDFQSELVGSLKSAISDLGLATFRDVTTISVKNLGKLFEQSERVPVQLVRFLHSQSLKLEPKSRTYYQEKLKPKSIRCLEFDRRSIDACKRLAIDSIDDLQQTPIGKIRALKGIGEKTIQRIVTAMKSADVEINTSSFWKSSDAQPIEGKNSTPLFPDWES